MRGSLAVVLAFGLLLLDAGGAGACGDKFLVIGRGRQFHRAAHPASILIYMRPASPMAAAAREIRLESSLKRAGHASRTVDDRRHFHEALRTGRYDIVLVDIAEANAAEEEARAVSARVAVVPVIHKPTRSELAAAEKQYTSFVKTPSRTASSFLNVIDAAMEQKLGR